MSNQLCKANTQVGPSAHKRKGTICGSEDRPCVTLSERSLPKTRCNSNLYEGYVWLLLLLLLLLIVTRSAGEETGHLFTTNRKGLATVSELV